jgi:hypothetical protein
VSPADSEEAGKGTRDPDLRRWVMPRTEGLWHVWRLGPSSDEQERLIVVAGEDDGTEVCGIVENEADAVAIAKVPVMIEVIRQMVQSTSCRCMWVVDFTCLNCKGTAVLKEIDDEVGTLPNKILAE